MMSDQPYKPHLDRLFVNAVALMEELSDNSDGCFTNQEFLKELARRNPVAYIEFLSAVKDRYLANPENEEKWIFNKTHQEIGRTLSNRAQALGYNQSKEGRTEADIWGNPTARVTYCR
jgi:hypothetical protein